MLAFADLRRGFAAALVLAGSALFLSFADGVNGVPMPRGVHLDIEPHADATWSVNKVTAQANYLTLLDSIRAELAKNSSFLELTADIPFWYASESFLATNLAQEVANRMDRVGIMAYRDWAAGTRTPPELEVEGSDEWGLGAGISTLVAATLSDWRETLFSFLREQDPTRRTDGIVTIAQGALDAARTATKSASIIVETSCGKVDRYATFCGHSDAYTEEQLAILDKSVKQSHATTFHRLAIHERASWMKMEPEKVDRSCATARDLFEWGLSAVTSAAGRAEFFSFCADHNIDAVYLDSEALIKQVAGGSQQMLRDFLTEAGNRNVAVELLFGRPQWVNPPNHAEVIQLMADVSAFLATLAPQTTIASCP